jgi:hypothetical protein
MMTPKCTEWNCGIFVWAIDVRKGRDILLYVPLGWNQYVFTIEKYVIVLVNTPPFPITQICSFVLAGYERNTTTVE